MPAQSKSREVDAKLIQDFLDWRSRTFKERSVSECEALAAFKAGHLLGLVRGAKDPDAFIECVIPDMAGLIPKEFMKLFKEFAGEKVRIVVKKIG